MGDEFGDESAVKSSYPDIDSALKMKELKEVDTQKKMLEWRIQRLQDSQPSLPVD
jgi:hypothetical protein